MTKPNQAPSDPTTHPHLGVRLRQLRQQQGFNLAQLADAAGVTSGLISQIEHGQADPSLTTLRRIAEALRVPMFYFFIHAKAEPRVRSPQDRYVLNDQTGGIEHEFISDPDEGHIEFTMVRARPGSASSDKQDHHPGRECALVLAGRMVMEIEDKVYELNARDSITFDSLRPHRWVNPGSQELSFISVTSWAFSQ